MDSIRRELFMPYHNLISLFTRSHASCEWWLKKHNSLSLVDLSCYRSTDPL